MGALTTHIDDILGCGDTDSLSEVRGFLDRRLGFPKVLQNSFVHVGMELLQAGDFSDKLAREDLANSRKPFPTTPAPSSAVGRNEGMSARTGGIALVAS